MRSNSRTPIIDSTASPTTRDADAHGNHTRLLNFGRTGSKQDSQIDYHDRGAANHGHSLHPFGGAGYRRYRRAAQSLDNARER